MEKKIKVSFEYVCNGMLTLVCFNVEMDFSSVILETSSLFLLLVPELKICTVDTAKVGSFFS